MATSIVSRLAPVTARDGVDTRKQATDNLSMDTIMDLGLPAVKLGNVLDEIVATCEEQAEALKEIIASRREYDLDEVVHYAVGLFIQAAQLKIRVPDMFSCSCGMEVPGPPKSDCDLNLCVDCKKNTCDDCGEYSMSLRNMLCLECETHNYEERICREDAYGSEYDNDESEEEEEDDEEMHKY